MLTVLRCEEKYLLSLPQALALEQRLSEVLRRDGAVGGYRVRSLYFDTPDDRDFFDKATEQNLRRKIRLRLYDIEDALVKIEMKQKQNRYQRKRSLLLAREEAAALCRGELSALLHHDEPFAAELFARMRREGYRAAAMVEYRRRAFTARENSLRLTFDSDVRVSESSLDLFAPQLPLYPVMESDRVILEVKYNGFVPQYAARLLDAVERRSESFSKYALARGISRGEVNGGGTDESNSL